jgi:hypothetical protein
MTLILASIVLQKTCKCYAWTFTKEGSARGSPLLHPWRRTTAQRQVRIRIQVPHDDLHTPFLRLYSLRPFSNFNASCIIEPAVAGWSVASPYLRRWEQSRKMCSLMTTQTKKTRWDSDVLKPPGYIATWGPQPIAPDAVEKENKRPLWRLKHASPFLLFATLACDDGTKEVRDSELRLALCAAVSSTNSIDTRVPKLAIKAVTTLKFTRSPSGHCELI